MKFIIFGLLYLSCLSFLPSVLLNKVDINGKPIPVYSMVWSAKSYTTTGKEQRTFFFAVPFSFYTQMVLDTKTKKFSFDFVNISSDLGNAKAVKEAIPLCRNSMWNQWVRFADQDPPRNVDLNMNLEAGFSVTNIRLYQNKVFRNIEIKIENVGSKFKNALYITFDLEKARVSEADRLAFENFFINTWPSSKVSGATNAKVVPLQLNRSLSSSPALRGSDANGKVYPVYSMVWSAKSYTTTGKEQRTFFFAVPFSFNTQMVFDAKNKKITFDFFNINSDLGNAKAVKEAIPLCRNSMWNQWVRFADQDPPRNVDLNLNFEGDFSVTNIRLYQNKVFRNVEIKIENVGSKFKNALYITFDLEKARVSEADRLAFENFFINTWPLSRRS